MDVQTTTAPDAGICISAKEARSVAKVDPYRRRDFRHTQQTRTISQVFTQARAARRDNWHKTAGIA
jgi:hypothetical protein